MISLKVDDNYLLDLEDDFKMNETDNLYQFLNKDPVRAYYLGMYISKWFKELDADKQYLYSKQLRHVTDKLDKYIKQINFWTDKLVKIKKTNELCSTELAEYILNNMFWNPKTEKRDKINVALYLGKKIKECE